MSDLKLSKHLTLHEFGDRDALAEVLSAEITHQLDRAIQFRGVATIAVSGGNTPLKLFNLLSQAELDWTRITVTLVDERWVSPDDARSNERLVKQNLLVGRAAFAQFLPFYIEGIAPEEASFKVCHEIVKLPLPFDVVILGMGADGHTASFFADADNYREAIDPAAGLPVIAMKSATAGEARMTLTMPMLITSRFLAVHIEGQDKRETLATALVEGSKLPISQVLERKDIQTNIFWAP